MKYDKWILILVWVTFRAFQDSRSPTCWRLMTRIMRLPSASTLGKFPHYQAQKFWLTPFMNNGWLFKCPMVKIDFSKYVVRIRKTNLDLIHENIVCCTHVFLFWFKGNQWKRLNIKIETVWKKLKFSSREMVKPCC